ncbi:MAG: hypothetical protein QOG15_1962 [Solirubrobacteraceae bacterium]|nr:hypothetical protein [Solirubrobacteraceae bacterium]
MGRSVDRERAEGALASLRGQLHDHPDIIGTGLGADHGVFVLSVLTRRRIAELPTVVDGVPVHQDVREAPRPWHAEAG